MFNRQHYPMVVLDIMLSKGNSTYILSNVIFLFYMILVKLNFFTYDSVCFFACNLNCLCIVDAFLVYYRSVILRAVCETPCCSQITLESGVVLLQSPQMFPKCPHLYAI